ncbi:MAG: O-antigen ligase family protein [Paenibacillaceae bacterium]|nr:O-antigen ligase family protein [Paenibacillaceae bacterium]
MKTIRALYAAPTTQQAAVFALGGAAFLFLALAIGFASAKLGHYESVQIAILTAILFPAFMLALVESRHIVPYILLVWAVCPEIRRIADWLEGSYHSVSLLSMAPLLASAMLAVPVLARIHRIDPSVRKLIVVPTVVLAYGSLLGLAHNGTGAIYDLANYLIPLLLIPYFAVTPFERKDQERLIVAYTNIAVLVAVYGIIQYIFVPAWDAFWMEHVEMNSIGKPEPLEIRVFSTLNSPGPAGMFMATALAPMIVERKWRGALGWFGVLLVAVGLIITLVRSSWVMLVVIVAVYVAISSGRQKWRLLAQLGAVTAALTWLVPKLPGAQGLVARLNTMTAIQDDYSYNERLDFFHMVFPLIKGQPQGLGLGSIGVGTKLGNGGALGQFGVFDNGFVAIFLTFGVIGGVLFFWTLWLLGKLLISRTSGTDGSAAYGRLAAASLIGSVVCLMFENGYTGLRGFLQWMVVGLGVVTQQTIAHRRRRTADGATDEPESVAGQAPVRVP